MLSLQEDRKEYTMKKLSNVLFNIIFSPVLLLLGIFATFMLLILYPFIVGLIKSKHQQTKPHLFLRYLWTALTLFFKR